MMMKHLSVVLAALSVLLVCAGCADSPQKVAVKWSKAIAEGNVKGANENSTGKTYPVNAVLCALMSSQQPEAQALAKAFRATSAKYASAEMKIDGDIAELTVAGEKEKLVLRRVDGAWKVDRADMLPPTVPAAAKGIKAQVDAAAKGAAVKVDAAAKDAKAKVDTAVKDAAARTDAAAKDAKAKVDAAAKDAAVKADGAAKGVAAKADEVKSALPKSLPAAK